MGMQGAPEAGWLQRVHSIMLATIICPPSQLCLGLVLPTLLVWHAQLAAARQLCQDAPPGPRRETMQQQFERSGYARLCRPALHAAGLAGWWLPLLMAALGGYQAGRLGWGGGSGGRV